MEYTWQIMKCNSCNNIHAMPVPSLHTIYTSSLATYMCPYCRSEQLIYGSKCDKMIANKGINKDETYKIEITLKDKLAYTE